MFDQVKAHVKRHQTVYRMVAIAGITCIIMRGRHAGVALSIPDTAAKTVFVRPLSFFSKQNVVTVIAREGRGHPGYLVHCRETGNIFFSQAEAAKSVGTIPITMSRHLRGEIPHVYGLHFERIAA